MQESDEENFKRKWKSKPKVKMLWQPEDVRLLITAIEQHPSIWDYSSAEYKNIKNRIEAWNAVKAMLDNRYGIPECKAKWTNVKTVYQKAKANMLIESKKSKDSINIKPCWPYWNEMQFLAKTNESASNTKNIINALMQQAESDSSSNSRRIIKRRRKPYDHSTSPSSPQASDSMGRTRLNVMDTCEQDEWQIIGNYLGAQLRNIASKNRKKADSLHRELTRHVLVTLDEIDPPLSPSEVDPLSETSECNSLN